MVSVYKPVNYCIKRQTGRVLFSLPVMAFLQNEKKKFYHGYNTSDIFFLPISMDRAKRSEGFELYVARFVPNHNHGSGPPWKW